MPEVSCKDCGTLGTEDLNDFAPNLCPDCYETRLSRISPQFARVVDESEDPNTALAWLERALVEMGGETPAWAHTHVLELKRQMRSR